MKEAPPHTRKLTSAALTPDDLARVRGYRNYGEENGKVGSADFSAALRLLPAELHEEAAGRIKFALRLYFLAAPHNHRPREGVLARYFRAIEAKAHELSRLMLYSEDSNTEYYAITGEVPAALFEELCDETRGKAALKREEVFWLVTRLERLRDVARDGANRNEEQRRAGRPAEIQIRELLTVLRPLWQAAANPAAFVEECLAAVGEGRGVEAVRKAIERFGQNG